MTKAKVEIDKLKVQQEQRGRSKSFDEWNSLAGLPHKSMPLRLNPLATQP